MKWKVRIIGPTSVLQQLSVMLYDKCFIIQHDLNNQYYLESSQFNKCSNAEEVSDRARNILAVLNGTIKLQFGGGFDLKTSEIVQELPDGKEIVTMIISETINIHSSLHHTIRSAAGEIVDEQKPDDFIPIWMKASLNDETINKVLRLFGKHLSWTNLYRILEIIEQDIGGKDKIFTYGWALKTEIGDFKHSCNSPTVSGDNSRHGIERTQSPKAPMSLSQAHILITKIVRAWLGMKTNCN